MQGRESLVQRVMDAASSCQKRLPSQVRRHVSTWSMVVPRAVRGVCRRYIPASRGSCSHVPAWVIFTVCNDVNVVPSWRLHDAANHALVNQNHTTSPSHHWQQPQQKHHDMTHGSITNAIHNKGAERHQNSQLLTDRHCTQPPNLIHPLPTSANASAPAAMHFSGMSACVTATAA